MIRSKVEWWRKLQHNEEPLARLAVQMKPGLSYVSVVTVLADIGHRQNAEVAEAMIRTMTKDAALSDLPPTTPGLSVLLELFKHRGILGL